MKRFNQIITVLMILLGLFFASNIYVLGNRQAAIEMHEDFPPDASALLANAKVIVCFMAGVLFVIAGIAIFRKNPKWALCGVWASALFIGFYLIQIILYARSYSVVLIGFAIFGPITGLFGYFSLRQWRKRMQN